MTQVGQKPNYANVYPSIDGVEPDDSLSWYIPGGGVVRIDMPGWIYSDQPIGFILGISRGTPIGVFYLGDPGAGEKLDAWTILDISQLMQLMELSAGTRTVELKAMIAPGETTGDLFSAWDPEKATTLGFFKDQEPPGSEEPVGDAFIDGTVNAMLCNEDPIDGNWVVAIDIGQCQLDVRGSLTAFGAASVTGGALISIGGHPMSVVYFGSVPDTGLAFNDAFQFLIDDVRDGFEPIKVAWQPVVANSRGDVFAAYDPDNEREIAQIVFEGHEPEPGNGAEPDPDDPIQKIVVKAQLFADEHPWATGAIVAIAILAGAGLVRRS